MSIVQAKDIFPAGVYTGVRSTDFTKNALLFNAEALRRRTIRYKLKGLTAG
jgi:hypothetical protein